MVAESLPAHLCRVSRAVARSYLVPPPRQQEKEYIEELCRIAEREKADLLVPTCEEVFSSQRAESVSVIMWNRLWKALKNCASGMIKQRLSGWRSKPVFPSRRRDRLYRLPGCWKLSKMSNREKASC